jgi:hypothetical protein
VLTTRVEVHSLTGLKNKRKADDTLVTDKAVSVGDERLKRKCNVGFIAGEMSRRLDALDAEFKFREREIRQQLAKPLLSVGRRLELEKALKQLKIDFRHNKRSVRNSLY